MDGETPGPRQQEDVASKHSTQKAKHAFAKATGFRSRKRSLSLQPPIGDLPDALCRCTHGLEEQRPDLGHHLVASTPPPAPVLRPRRRAALRPSSPGWPSASPARGGCFPDRGSEADVEQIADLLRSAVLIAKMDRPHFTELGGNRALQVRGAPAGCFSAGKRGAGCHRARQTAISVCSWETYCVAAWGPETRHRMQSGS